jgi:flagellar hook-associated protein 3 FlgL
MIDLSSQMIYRIGNLNAESERISYQMSTGKVLQNGSDDSVLFARY